MVTSTIFSIFFLFFIITKSSFADLNVGAKRELVNPLNDSSRVLNQNAVPVSQ